MEEKQLLVTNAIDTEDWKQTPTSVKKLVMQLNIEPEQLAQQLQDLQQSNQDLQEKVNRNSRNSHSPSAEASLALSEIVEQDHEYIKSSEQVSTDETGFN